MNNTLSYHIADYVEGLADWTHIATIRPHNYTLNIENSSTIMKRFHSYKVVPNIFWVLEKDTSRMNHLHLLMEYIDLDTDMKAARGRVNEMLGARWDSGLVGHIDLIDKSKVKGAINYACKYINTNSAYGFEV